MSFVSRLAGVQERPQDAVRRNLSAIYNTRRGGGSVLPGFGLGDYDTYLADADVLRVELQQQAAAHEPRVADPRVVLEGRDRHGRILLTLTGSLADEPFRLQIRFHIATHAVEVH